VCNGHAQMCDESNPAMPNKLICRCSHNTCGDQCQTCCPGFIQKKWRPNKEGNEFICEPCQCYGHSKDCKYDEEVERKKLSIDIHGNYEGGGVCQNCQVSAFIFVNSHNVIILYVIILKNICRHFIFEKMLML
jgi:laminin alpha 3/5